MKHAAQVLQSGENMAVTLHAPARAPIASILVLEVKDGNGAPARK